LFQKFQKFGFLVLQGRNFQYPKTRLISVYFDKVVLVVATEDKLAKKFHLPFVLSLGLQFIDVGRTEVFDAFGKFFLIEEYFIYTYEEFVSPVRIELAAKAIIGQIGHVIVEHCFQPLEKSSFTRRPLLGY
jgi:hypothetical protein